ncbi:MAG: hypothetical protein IH804_03910, partial [Planctomycetes bacterium]|nr:hypothetical protein [Planctomycetota bacterium]
GQAQDGRLLLFVEGKGRHDLAIELVAPLATDSALQTLNIRVPTPASTQFHLTVGGDVDVERGPAVMSRVFDPVTETTRIDLALDRDRNLLLVMTLNSRLKREQRLVVARGVQVSEVTQAYEKLHATFSMGVLHRAVDRFRFEVPAGFEITDVSSPQLAQWTVLDTADGRELDVRLREPAGGTVVLGVSAVGEEPSLEGWRFPALRPLDVVSEATVVGLLVEDRLEVETLDTVGLMPIDTSVLTRALPAGVLRAEPEAPNVRPVVAYYAPQGSFDLRARLIKGPAELRVTTNLLLTVNETDLEVRGGFTLLPLQERCFEFDFTLPQKWQILEVTGTGGETLHFDRFAGDSPEGSGARIRVRLPGGIAVGDQQSVYFRASSVPGGWLDDWAKVDVPFPVFTVTGATSDTGAIAVATRDDIDVRPVVLEGLLPLDEQEKQKFGLGNVATTLAYRYDQQPYRASLAAERIRPRVIARTFSFFRIEPDQRAVHYEIIYDIEHARTRRLSLLLPETTPTALSISGLNGVTLKGFTHEPADGGMRRWTANLTEARLGQVRLAIDFQQRVDHTTGDDMALPVVRADRVAFQSGRLAVEGSSELEIEVARHPRPIDVGELVDAEYEPGRRLIGAFGFVGDSAVLSIKSARHAADAPPAAIVQHARLTTAVAANGRSQTAARFSLRTKALFLEIRLPADAELWTITLDGRPTKPQRDGERLVIDLASGPAAAVAALRELVIVYQSPVTPLDLIEKVELSGPRLRFIAQRGASAGPVPIADLQWDVYVPHGYDLLASGGTVVPLHLDAPRLAVSQVAQWLYRLSGGTPGPFWERGWVAASRDASMSSRLPQEQTIDSFLERSVEAPRREGVGRHERRAADAPMASSPRPPGAPGEKAKKDADARADLLGVRSLNIDLDRSGRLVTFRSLGVDPQVSLTLASRRRFGFMAWTMALVVIVFGLARSGRSAASRARFVMWIGLLATLAAIVTARRDVTLVSNAAFYAAALLVGFYLVLGGVRWMLAKIRAIGPRAVPATAVTALAAILMITPPAVADGQENDNDHDHGPPVSVPDDVVIVPYDPESGATDPPHARAGEREQLLVPYDHYLALWNLVHPDEPMGVDRPKAPFAMAGANYRAELRSDHSDPALTITGHLEIDVFVDEPVLVPLDLRGAVVATAGLDGQPAKLSVVGAADGGAAQTMHQMMRQRSGRTVLRHKPGLLLHVSGRGRHALDLVVRARLEQRGGWRVTR